MPFRLSPGGARPLAAVALAGASLVAAAVVGSIFLTSARDGWEAIAAPGPAGPADGILLVVALGGAALSLWLGLGTTLAALSTLPGALGQTSSRMAARIAPAAVRKVVAFVLGTALTAALVPGTALARGQEAPRSGVVASARQAVGAAVDAAPDASFRLVSDGIHDADAPGDVDAAPSPSWSTTEPATPIKVTTPVKPASPKLPASLHREPAPIELLSRGAAAGDPSSERGHVVVLRGDTLWSIAARHLGPAATTAEIDAEWHRWFADNLHAIGNDANLIQPGQQLSPPVPRGQR